jgi:hypothetical protein
MTEGVLDDARSSNPVERLLEDSWAARKRAVSQREFLVEASAAAIFLGLAIPLAIPALSSASFDPLLAAVLVGMYALASRMIEFPIGAGYVVPSYMVLVPMLLLLPPGLVPLLTAAGVILGTLGQALAGRVGFERAVFSIPDALHSLGPAAVLVAVPHPGGGLRQAGVYILAFAAGCLIDLISATLREAAILGVGSRVQIRVIAVVWLIDACVAPLGLIVAHAARHDSAEVLLLLPLNGVLLLLSRDRSARIEQAQRRLDLVARERSRLQTAVRRLGDALAAKLDMEALTTIVLRGSVEALDADAGRLSLGSSVDPRELELGSTQRTEPALIAAAQVAQSEDRAIFSARAYGPWRCPSGLTATSARPAGRSWLRARAARSGRTRSR